LNNIRIEKSMQKHRPRGVAILAILMILSGILSVFGTASGPLGIVSLALGIVYIIMGYGLFKGNRWAWTGTIISLFAGIAIGIISTILSISITSAQGGTPLSLIIIISAIGLSIAIGFSVIILYYLYRPHVKAYFGRSTTTT
jgi:hypothetical protein